MLDKYGKDIQAGDTVVYRTTTPNESRHAYAKSHRHGVAVGTVDGITAKRILICDKYLDPRYIIKVQGLL